MGCQLRFLTQSEGRHLLCNDQSIDISNIQFENSYGSALDITGATSSIQISNCIFSESNQPGPSPSRVIRSRTDFNTLADIQIQDCVFNTTEILLEGQTRVSITSCTFFSAELVANCSVQVTLSDLIMSGICNLEIGCALFGADNEGVLLENITADSFSNSQIKAVIKPCSSNNETDFYPINIVNVSGRVSLDLGQTSGYPQAEYLISSCNFFGLEDQNNLAVVQIGTGSSLTISETTISNNSPEFAAIYNGSTTPFSLLNTVVCGNEPVNIYGPYNSTNSFVLPNCGSFYWGVLC